MWATALVVGITALLHVTCPQTPPNLTGAIYKCNAKGCGGQCMRGYCPFPYDDVNTDLCYCPGGMKCCKNRTVTIRCSQCSPSFRCVSNEILCASPVLLHTCSCPKGQKCCKGPFCSECSGTCMKACQQPFYQIIHQKCPCPVGMVCCRASTTDSGFTWLPGTATPCITFEAASCERTCKNAKCVPEKSECKSEVLNEKCSCPPAQKCCTLSPCLYKPCIEKDKCTKAGGQSVPANNCPNGQVCCKGTCTCPHGPCKDADMCVKLGGTIIPSLNCMNGTACCKGGSAKPTAQCKMWLLLGPTAETTPAGLHGLVLEAGGTSLTTGPNGLNAWAFNGINNGVKILSAGQLNFGKDSFTIATYVYQDVVTDGPIVNWQRKSGNWGAHLWFHTGKLYSDLDPGKGTLTSALIVKQWVFAGVSFNHTTGMMLLWYDANTYETNVGKADKDTSGAELYVGFNIYNTGSIRRFTGRLAGTTVMNCSITKEQIPALEKHIVAIAKPGSDVFEKRGYLSPYYFLFGY